MAQHPNVELIEPWLAEIKNNFNSGVTQDAEFRK
jgi:hypothetical protein